MKVLVDWMTKFNTTMTALRWVVVIAMAVLPTAVVTWIYSTTDQLWTYYGWIGVAVALLAVMTIFGVCLGGLGIFLLATKKPEPPVRTAAKPELPLHTLNVGEVFGRVGEHLNEQGVKADAEAIWKVVSAIYDGLRSGHVLCWGHKSDFYPPKTNPPHAPRVFIEALFWSHHLIEELERSRKKLLIDKNRGWVSITMPDPDRFNRREIVTCYWDLAFDPSTVRRKWPLKNDWMTA